MTFADPDPLVPHGDELRAFAGDGVAVLREVVSRGHAAELREVGQRLLDSPRRRGRETQADGWDSFRGAAYLDDRFAELALHPRLLTFMTVVLGPNLHLMSSQLIRLRPSRGPRVTRVPGKPGWHRDVYGMAADVGYRVPCCAIKACVWLTDTDEARYGGTLYAPGSHRLESPLAIAADQVDPETAVSPRARAGDAVLFENRTWHAGGFNLSEQDCWCLMYQYGYRWMARVDPLRARPALLREAGPVARQMFAGKDTTPDGHYVAGSGARALAAWAQRHGLARALERNP